MYVFKRIYVHQVTGHEDLADGGTPAELINTPLIALILPQHTPQDVVWGPAPPRLSGFVGMRLEFPQRSDRGTPRLHLNPKHSTLKPKPGRGRSSHRVRRMTALPLPVRC